MTKNCENFTAKEINFDKNLNFFPQAFIKNVQAA
jgi:hypothetical protein